jgi:plasmid stabilization system protein ParE
LEKTQLIIRYTPESRAELSRVLEQIRRASPSGSRNVARRIRQVIELLKAHPNAGRRTDEPSIRRIIANPYPYLIFYERRDAVIVIHSVRHAARNPDEMPGSGADI